MASTNHFTKTYQIVSITVHNFSFFVYIINYQRRIFQNLPTYRIYHICSLIKLSTLFRILVDNF